MRTLSLLLAALSLPLAAQQPQTRTAPIAPINAKYVNGMAPGYWPTAGSGLSLNVSSGTTFCNGTLVQYAGGTVTLSASATSYVYIDPTNSCGLSVSTSAFPASAISVAVAQTSSSAITGVTDARTPFSVGPSNSSGIAGTAQHVGMIGSAGNTMGDAPLILAGTSGPVATWSSLVTGSKTGLVMVEPGSSSTDAVVYLNNALFSNVNVGSGVPWFDMRGGSARWDAANWGQTGDCQYWNAPIGSCLFKTSQSTEAYAYGLSNFLGISIPGYAEGPGYQYSAGFSQNAGLVAPVGIKDLHGEVWTVTGSGDLNVYDSRITDKPNWREPGDEGPRFYQDFFSEAPPASGNVSAGTAGQTNVPMTCTSNCQLWGNGSPLIDLSTNVLTGTATVASAGVLTTSFTVPVSTVLTITSGVTVPVAQAFNHTTTGTVTVTASAAPSVGQLISFWGGNGANQYETTKITAVTSPSSGTYTLTAAFHYSHAAGEHSCSGGMVGRAIEYYDHTHVLLTGETDRRVEQVVCSTASNSVTVGEQSAGGWATVSTTGTVYIYHAAEIIDARNPSTGVIDGGGVVVTPNDAFPSGAVVQNTGPIQAHWDLEHKVVNINNPYASWTEHDETYGGAGIASTEGGGYSYIHIGNGDSMYRVFSQNQTTPGILEVPNWQRLGGPWGSGLLFDQQPGGGLIFASPLSNIPFMMGVSSWDANGPSIIEAIAIGNTQDGLFYNHAADAWYFGSSGQNPVQTGVLTTTSTNSNNFLEVRSINGSSGLNLQGTYQPEIDWSFDTGSNSPYAYAKLYAGRESYAQYSANNYVYGVFQQLAVQRLLGDTGDSLTTLYYFGSTGTDGSGCAYILDGAGCARDTIQLGPNVKITASTGAMTLPSTGVTLPDTTNGHTYRIQMVNGVVTATLVN